MRFVASIWIAIAIVMCLISDPTLRSVSASASDKQRRIDLYDPDPNHIWNRVHRLLHVRVAADGSEYGDDEIDPLLWYETKYLLVQPSHGVACNLLDEFLTSGAERLIKDPVKRAVFQHDLWAVFDWTAHRPDDNPEARHALATRLARMIRRVALTKQQIDHLPDNYSAAVSSRAFAEEYDPQHAQQAFLPRRLFDRDGPWVNINGSFSDPTAIQHSTALSHSEFSVLMSVPTDTVATLNYLKALWDFPEPFLAEPVHDDLQRSPLNPELPQIPSGTRVALARRMLLVDNTGVIRPSTLTEDVQLRVFHDPSRNGAPDARGSYADQEFFEFRTRRRDLFPAHAGGFHMVAPGEFGFITFSAQGVDQFEDPRHAASRGGAPITGGCVNCHSGRGIQSLLIAPRLLKPYPRVDYRHPRWSVYAQPAVEAKARRFDWGLLNGLWQSSPW